MSNLPACDKNSQNDSNCADLKTKILQMDLGSYSRSNIQNLSESDVEAKALFDRGLIHLFAFHHEQATKCFLECLKLRDNVALAHALIAHCHSPNYNFFGESYYSSFISPSPDGCHEEFPSQILAEYHSKRALELMTDDWDELESIIIKSIRVRTCRPGISSEDAEKNVSRPFANSLGSGTKKFPDDAELLFFFAESLMVINAWSLFEYPNGRPLSPDVPEIQRVLEHGLQISPRHPGLCHLYVHLSEMSSTPEMALEACKTLRVSCPDAGHLLHMPTHIDVLVGDYENCVECNLKALEADKKMMKIAPETSGPQSFYFGYIAHNYHMLIYGAMMGGMMNVALEKANELNQILVYSDIFVKNPGTELYLESYSALDIHIMVRFGKWEELLCVSFPERQDLMLYRTATLLGSRSLAYAALGNVESAKEEFEKFEMLRANPCIQDRILHNNNVADLLAVESYMIMGEILYREEKYDQAFVFLRQAVKLEDSFHYDEPWGRMQPVRHALGGLLLEQGRWKEAEEVFRADLLYHPKNPWSLTGIMQCLTYKRHDVSQHTADQTFYDIRMEQMQIELELNQRRSSRWADFDIYHSCSCVGRGHAHSGKFKYHIKRGGCNSCVRHTSS